MPSPDCKATYYIQHPGQPEEVVGTTTLISVTEAAIKTFSREGGRRMERENAITLGSVLNGAAEAGAPKDLITQAFKLGEKIGQVLAENPTKKLRDRTVYRWTSKSQDQTA